MTGATAYNVYFNTVTGVTTASATKTTNITVLTTNITGLTNATPYYFIVTAIGSGGESAASSEVSATPMFATVTPNDPLFAQQWHLKNTGQLGQDSVAALAGQDLNITSVWTNYTGAGIRIAVIDDGLDIAHEDLSPNVVPNKSWDYTLPNGGAYGSPSATTGSHGTSCGGLAAAKGNNSIGVTGVAFNSSLVGYNLLATGNTNMAAAAHSVTLDLATNDVYSNSYGASDDRGLYFDADSAWEAAINTGITTGRGGKGSVYAWAAGNGAATVDRSDYDGQANYGGVLAIGALNSQGKKASYSEEGANILAMGFGGEDCSTQQTVSADVTGMPGYNTGTSPNDLAGQAGYTRCFNGTSASCPQGAGLAALLLQANPNLSWRDVRYILATTSRKNDATDTDWVKNKGGTGLWVNHKYGFGTLDAAAAISRATTNYGNLPALLSPAAQSNLNAQVIPDNTGTLITSTITVAASGVTKLEFVDVTVRSSHTGVGDLAITITSPSGTVRTLALQHTCRDAMTAVVPCGGWNGGVWRFGVAQLVDEPADGTWTLTIRDEGAGGTGSLTGWSIGASGH